MSTSRVLHLGDGLDVPADDFVESATAILAKRGGGKTGLGKVIEEEAFRLGIQFVTFDPAGVHWGIRSSYDGKGAGLPVLVIGGEHADIPLDRKAGAQMARAVIESNISCIIDLKGSPKAVYREFARDFADELYAKNDSPRLVIFEEAAQLLPQTVRPDQAQSYDAIERLVSMGRNCAIGVVLIGQRPAKINKDVLTQVDTLFIGRLLSPQDRKALREWVENWDQEARLKEYETSLAALPTRTLWVWSPEALEKFEPFHVRAFKTLHADKTHMRKMNLLKFKPVTTDVAGVVSKLGAELKKLSEEKVELSQVPALRARVRVLEDQLKAAKPVAAAVDDKSVRALLRSQEAAGQEIASRMAETDGLRGWAAETVLPAVRAARKAVDDLEGAMRAEPRPVSRGKGWKPSDQPIPTRNEVPVSTPAYAERHTEPRVRAPQEIAAAADGDRPRPTGGALRMLRVLVAEHPNAMGRMDLGALAGISPGSGTFSDYLSILRRGGFAVDDQSGCVTATDVALAYFDGRVPRMSQAERATVAQDRTSGGARRMLDELVKAYPESLTREELGQRAEIAHGSGTFSDYLSILRRYGYATTDRGSARAADILFG